MQQDTTPDRRKTHAVPRWVKIFALTFACLFVLFALVHLTGEGLRHGPSETGSPELHQ